MKTKVIQVSEEAEKELEDLCDKMFKWAKKYKVNYVTATIFYNCKDVCNGANATYLIDDRSNCYQYVSGKHTK